MLLVFLLFWFTSSTIFRFKVLFLGGYFSFIYLLLFIFYFSVLWILLKTEEVKKKVNMKL
jgi:hypothetical protein